MAKDRNKKKNNKGGVAPMETSSEGFVTLPQAPQPMDTTEGPAANNLGSSSINRKINKGPQVRRAKNLRKMKAIARAVSINDKKEEKVVKMKTKKEIQMSAQDFVSIMFSPDRSGEDTTKLPTLMGTSVI